MSTIVQAIGHKHRGILAILALFLVLGLSYSLTIPLFETPAEDAHFRYARYITEKNGLPSIPPDDQFPQEHQAPLYYLLTSALISPLDLSSPSLPQLNPYHVYNAPGPIEDNRNSYYHTQDEAFPYHGLILAVHIGRIVALILGALTVLATYAIAYELFSSLPWLFRSGRTHPNQMAIALGAAAINAFNPQFVFVASVMSNDSAAAAFSGWSLFVALLILQRGISWRRSLLLGITVGLAALSKLNGLVLIPIAILALAIGGISGPAEASWQNSHSQLRRERLKLWLIHTTFVCAVISLVAGWWYVRNWLLYRDPFTLKLAAERWGSAGDLRSFAEIMSHGREIEVGFWGLFGHDNLPMDSFVYDVLHIVELLALAGLVTWGIRVWRDARQDGQPLWTIPFWSGLGLVALSFLAALAGLYRWLQITTLPAGRYLYPAISSISVLLSLGLSGLVPRRLISIVAGGTGIGLLILSLVTPFRYIIPAYVTPPLLTTDETISNLVDVSYAGRINLVGYKFQEEVVRPGDWLHVTLYWEISQPLDADLTVALRVLGQGGEIVGSKDTFPGLGRYPTSLWQPGLIVKDTYPVQIAFGAKSPSRLLLDVTLYHHPTMFVLPKAGSTGNELSQLALGEAKLIPYSVEPIAIPNETDFTLGNDIRLVGYSLSKTSSYSPGSLLDLTLYWQSLAKPSADYTVFIHLLDDESLFAASWDAPPMGGDYPTHMWSEEEVVKDLHQLNLPPDIPPGDYQLFVGLYQPDTSQRLPALDANGHRLGDDAVRLLTLPVR